jgi:hypothetical protein
MTFTIPNVGSATYTAQAEVDTNDLAIMLAGAAGTGIQSGGVVSPYGSMQVQNTAGVAIIANVVVTFASATPALSAADPTNPRFDLVSVNNAGVVSITTGTPAASPVFPAIPANSAVLAAIYVPATATSIASLNIVDKRVLLIPEPRDVIFVAASNARASAKTNADYVCTGANDNVTVAAAIATAQVTGAMVKLSEGTFTFGASLALSTNTPIRLEGSGWNTLLTLANGVNDYVLKFAGAANVAFSGWRFAEMTVNGNMANQTAGGGFDLEGAVQCEIQHIHFTNCYNYCLILGPMNGGAFGHHNRVLGCLFDNCSASAGYGVGTHTTSSDENFIAFCDYENCGNPTGAQPQMAREEAGLSVYLNCVFVGGAGGGQGLTLQNVQNVRVIGCTFDGCQMDSLHMSASACTVIGCNFTNGGIRAANSYSHIYMDFGNNNTITGNVFQSPSTNGQLQYFINEQGSQNSNTVIGNTFKINGTLGSGLANRSNGTPASVWQSNTGYVTRSSGTGSLAAATTLTVTHGLSGTPSRVEVTPTSDPGAGIRWWISAKTATTFTITTSAAATFSFDWHAWIGDAG